jgi:hypothetical protein
MSVISEGQGHQAKISVLKTFSLIKEKAKISQSRRASTAQPVVRPKPAHLQAAGRRTPSVKSRPSLPPSLSRQPEPSKPLAGETVPRSELTSLKFWAENAINSQQRDVERISGTVERIEKGMQSFREFMEEVQTELASSRQIQNHASEENLVLVREDLDGSRLQIESDRAGTKSSSTQDAELSNQKLEIIVRNLQRVSAKANEVDNLKMEIEQLKARLHQTADVAQTGIQHSEVMQSIEAGSGPTFKRKRNQIDHENNSGHYDMSPELPTKRQIIPNSTKSTIENSAVLQGVSARWNPNFPNTSSDNYEAPDMPPTSNKRLVIEITSSKPDISPSRVSQYDERGKFVYEEENIDDNYRPNFPKNKLISSVSALSRPRRRASSTVIPNTPISAFTPSPRELRSSVAPESHSNIKVDLCTGKLRDQNGALITSEGKIDGRSLRYKKLPLRELDSNTAADPGPASPPKDTARPSDTRVDSSPIFVKPMLPRQNVMTPASEMGYRSNSVMSMSMPPSSQPHPKPFQCGGCGVRYRAVGGLEYHKEISSSPSCKSPEKDEIPMEFKCSDCGKTWKTVGQYEQVFQSLSFLISISIFSFLVFYTLFHLDEQEYIDEKLASL